MQLGGCHQQLTKWGNQSQAAAYILNNLGAEVLIVVTIVERAAVSDGVGIVLFETVQVTTF